MNNDGGNRAIDLCLRARHADLDQPVRRWYGAGTLAQPVRVEAQSVRVIIPPLRAVRVEESSTRLSPVGVVEIDFAPPAGDFAGVTSSTGTARQEICGRACRRSVMRLLRLEKFQTVIPLAAQRQRSRIRTTVT
jgi:hypothetical protein